MKSDQFSDFGSDYRGCSVLAVFMKNMKNLYWPNKKLTHKNKTFNINYVFFTISSVKYTITIYSLHMAS